MSGEEQLPEKYSEYSTTELLVIWDKIAGGGLKEEPDIPPEMMMAVRGLVWDYKLSPEAQMAAGMIPLNLEKASTH